MLPINVIASNRTSVTVNVSGRTLAYDVKTNLITEAGKRVKVAPEMFQAIYAAFVNASRNAPKLTNGIPSKTFRQSRYIATNSHRFERD